MKYKLLLTLIIGIFLLASISAYCGDSVIDGDEQCDDGNTIGDDGCSSKCEVCAMNKNCSSDNSDDEDSYKPRWFPRHHLPPRFIYYLNHHRHR